MAIRSREGKGSESIKRFEQRAFPRFVFADESKETVVADLALRQYERAQFPVSRRFYSLSFR
jgi:hypothetical protein